MEIKKTVTPVPVQQVANEIKAEFGQFILTFCRAGYGTLNISPPLCAIEFSSVPSRLATEKMIKKVLEELQKFDKDAAIAELEEALDRLDELI